MKMKAKLIRTELDPKGRYWFNNYIYECIECGKEFSRHTYNERINPYCGDCCRKHDAEKAKQRYKEKLSKEYERGVANGYRMALQDLGIIKREGEEDDA